MSNMKPPFGKIYRPRQFVKTSSPTADPSAAGDQNAPTVVQVTTVVTTETSPEVSTNIGEMGLPVETSTEVQIAVGDAEQADADPKVILRQIDNLSNLLETYRSYVTSKSSGISSSLPEADNDGDELINDTSDNNHQVEFDDQAPNYTNILEILNDLLPTLVSQEVDGILEGNRQAELDELTDYLTKFLADQEEQNAIREKKLEERLVKKLDDLFALFRNSLQPSIDQLSDHVSSQSTSEPALTTVIPDSEIPSIETPEHSQTSQGTGNAKLDKSSVTPQKDQDAEATGEAYSNAFLTSEVPTENQTSTSTEDSNSVNFEPALEQVSSGQDLLEDQSKEHLAATKSKTKPNTHTVTSEQETSPVVSDSSDSSLQTTPKSGFFSRSKNSDSLDIYTRMGLERARRRGLCQLNQERLNQIPLLPLEPQPIEEIDFDEDFWKRLSRYYLKLLELGKWKKIELGSQRLILTHQELDQGKINQKTTDKIWLETWTKELERRKRLNPESELTIDDVKGYALKQFFLSTASLTHYNSSGEAMKVESLISFPVQIDEYGNISAFDEFYSGNVPAEYQPRELIKINQLSSEQFQGLTQAFAANNNQDVEALIRTSLQGAETASVDAAKGSGQLDANNWNSYLDYIYNFHRQASHAIDQAIAENRISGISSVNGKVSQELYLQEETRIDANQYLISLIRNYLNPNKYRRSKSLVRLVGNEVEPENAERLKDIDQQINQSGKHYGFYSRRFPLAESQRQALHSLLEDYYGGFDISAISGPPGTGKTTLISTVLAQKLVEHAIAGKSAPYILTSAVTNQALVNIIESFQIAPIDQQVDDHTKEFVINTGIEQRFLPDYTKKKYLAEVPKNHAEDLVITDGRPDAFGFSLSQPLRDLGWYIYGSPSSVACRPELHKYKLQNPWKSDVFGLFSSPEYKHRAAYYFLNQFNKYIAPLCENLQFANTLEEAQSTIRALLARRKNSLDTAFERIDNLIEELGEDFNHDEEIFPAETISKIDQRFTELFEDVCTRYPSIVQARLSFLNHPHEPKALIAKLREELEKEYYSNNLHTELGSSQVSEDMVLQLLNHYLNIIFGLYDLTYRADLYWLAVHYYEAEWLIKAVPLLNPTIDVNLFCNLFPVVVGTVFTLPRLFCNLQDFRKMEDADLLIIDEAGQAPVHQAIPCLDMAKHALIVGDCLQLQPVEQFSMGFLQDLGTNYFKPEEYERLETHNLSGFSGESLMSAATKMSGWKQESGQGGLILKEHYRCYPEIIDFCSKLFYNGALKPQRPSAFKDKANPQPNELPLDYVLVENSRSEEVGSSKINRVEAEAIKNWLDENSEKLQDCFKDKIGRSMQLANIVTVITQYEKQAVVLKEVINSEEKYKHIRIGTVNTMQGSERPVVLFSSVYGANAEGTGYIDTNTSIINVAVSRAKNQFILFGCKKHLFGESNVFNHFKQAFLNQSKSMPDNHVKKSRLSIAGPVSQPEPQNQTQDSSNLSWS